VLGEQKAKYAGGHPMNLSELLLPEFDRETAFTRTTLERCPEDKFDWRPHERSFTLAALATHLATMINWGADTITLDSFDIAPPGSPPYKLEPASSRRELLEKFDEGAAAFRAALAKATNERLMENWSLLAGGKTIFTMPRFSVIRSMVLNHMIHHRAQLGVYLRLNNVPLPAIYGPSADEGAM
jgi:uncharacterized damage-inducible protein DinB